MQSEQINELATALAKAWGAMSNAAMNKVNPHFKSRYADLSSVLDAIRGPLAMNGLIPTQTIELRDNAMVLRTTLLHTSGQWLASEYPLPIAGRPHEIGSALTYARRYSLAAMVCNSADEDDDANAAQDAKKTLPKKDARGIYEKMQIEVRDCLSRDQLKEWMDANKDRIEVLPEDWQDILRLQCTEMMADLRQQEAA